MAERAIIAGVCATCQSQHPVEPDPMRMTYVPGFAPYEPAEEYFIMADHNIWGEYGPQCEGAGQNPETLVHEPRR